MDRMRADRHKHLLLVLLALFGFLGVHLVNLSLIQSGELRERVKGQLDRTDTIRIGRGRVLDKKGRVLAGNIPAISLFADAKQIESVLDAEEALKAVAHLKGVDKKAFMKHYANGKRFFWVARNVDPRLLPFVKSDGGRYHSTIKALSVLETEGRVYPKGAMAGFLIGFTGVDNQGLEGLELMFEKKLQGKEGSVSLKRDGRGRPIPGSAKVIRQAKSGADVELTLDSFIQHSAEKHLQDAVVEYKAKAGHAVVVDPWTGAVLAMASVPRINPALAREQSPEFRRNRMVTDVYEPGSVFKTVLAAGALEEKIITDTETFPSPAALPVGRFVIKDSSHKSHGQVTVKTMLQKSLNTTAVLIGFKMGPEALAKYVKGFGFGQPTGLELAYESPGLWPSGDGEWKKIQVATISFGHGIAVTPLQIARAYTAIANGGVLVPLHLVESVGGKPFIPKGGRTAPKRVISPETANKIKEYLRVAVEEKGGTGARAMIPDFHVAGKTGTTRKIRAGGRGYESRYIGSFAGLFPLDQPRYVMVVTIDDPKGSGYGGVVAAPVFRKIGQDIAFYEKLNPDFQVGKQGPKAAYLTKP